PRRVRRMTGERRHVGLLNGNDAARPCQAHGFLEENFGPARGAADEAHMDEIEAVAGQAGVVGIAYDERDVRGRPAARVLQKPPIGVETYDTASRAHALAEQRCDAAGAAAEIETGPARSDADTIEHHGAVGRHGGGLDVQAFDLAVAMFQRIAARGLRRHAASPPINVPRASLYGARAAPYNCTITTPRGNRGLMAP